MRMPETKGERIRWGVVAAVVIVGAWFISSRFEDLDLQQLLEDVASTLGEWTYVLAGLLAFLETGAFVGLVVPGETFVVLAGAVAGVGETNIYITIAIVWFSAWAGDSVSFLIGRRLGRGFIQRHGPKIRITPERFRQVEAYFARHGGKTILVGRFIGLVRALAPFIAGSSGMAYRAFAPYSVLGTGLWAGAFSVLGYFGARSIEELDAVIGRGIFLFGFTVGAIVAFVLVVRFLRVAENRRRATAWMEARPVLRPLVRLGRRVKPQARFLWNRVTPGGLGLELTALLAMLSVAAFVLVAYTSIFSADPAATAADRTALDVAGDLHSVWLSDVAGAVAALGTTAATLAVAVVAGAGFAWARRWTELAVLVVALAIVFAAVPGIDGAVDRPRPPDAPGASDGSSFPSGHAAHSIVFAWLGMTLAVRLRPGRAGGSALVLTGLVAAAAIGLSRVYQQVDFLSDVTAGWALGTAAFAACATVALVAGHLRDNGPA
jgi:membrane protein DedA with SNARE-associated domain/membrane-associated phospholipid phosphatase